MKRVKGFTPIYNNHSKILILGSFPSVVSRENNFYYANKNNRFWKILEKLFNTTFPNINDKIDFLLKNNIALWDIVESCNIIGSSDAKISNYKINDINKIIKDSNIKAIFCTGKKSYELFIKHISTDIEVFYLPSPSSANAVLSLENLISNYKIILDYLK